MAVLSGAIARFCKEVLRQYPLLKRELATIEEERQAIACAVPVATWKEPVRAEAVGDRTATAVFRLLRLEERWRQVRFYVQAVEDVLAQLDEEKRQLVELRFFDGLPPWRVAEILHTHETTVFRWQAEVLEMLAHRLGL